LTLKDISNFLERNAQEAAKYFPCDKEQLKLPKQWVINVTASIFGNSFCDWIDEQVEKRNHRVAVQKDIMINMDPEIAAAFNKSTAVSTTKGNGY